MIEFGGFEYTIVSYVHGSVNPLNKHGNPTVGPLKPSSHSLVWVTNLGFEFTKSMWMMLFHEE